MSSQRRDVQRFPVARSINLVPQLPSTAVRLRGRHVSCYPEDVSPFVPLLILLQIFLPGARPATAGENPPNIAYAYPAVHEQTLDSKILGLCLAAINDAYPGGVKFGRTEVMCKRLPKPLAGLEGREVGPPPPQPYSGVAFSNYIAGTERNCDFATRHEGELRAWVLSQSDNSIDPFTLYSIALRMNHGSVWGALITIHQLLRNEARWWDKSSYSYESTAAAEERFFNKFVDIHGRLKERGPRFGGDHPGAWYRIWAAMLFRLSFARENAFERSSAPAQLACQKPRDRLATLRGSAQDLMSSLLVGADGVFHGVVRGDDSKKAELNVAGSETAAWMLKGAADPDVLRREAITAEACSNRSYLYTREPHVAAPAPAAGAKPMTAPPPSVPSATRK